MTWIKVDDRLPERGEYVLIAWDGFQYQPGAFYDHQQKKWKNLLTLECEEKLLIDGHFQNLQEKNDNFSFGRILHLDSCSNLYRDVYS